MPTPGHPLDAGSRHSRAAGAGSGCGQPLVGLEIGGDDAALRMVAAGLAAAEVEARAARRGLWADPEPMPPWEWRATEKARKAAQREPAGR